VRAELDGVDDLPIVMATVGMSRSLVPRCLFSWGKSQSSAVDVCFLENGFLQATTLLYVLPRFSSLYLSICTARVMLWDPWRVRERGERRSWSLHTLGIQRQMCSPARRLDAACMPSINPYPAGACRLPNRTSVCSRPGRKFQEL
jgi:hypothetical protein